MTTQEIITLLETHANNCAIVRDLHLSDTLTHERHWELSRLMLLDIIAYINHNSNKENN